MKHGFKIEIGVAVLVILAVIGMAGFVGCDSPAPASTRDYKPLAAAVLLIDGEAPAPTPSPDPSGKCSNCRGTGKLGDGTVSVPCPVCGGDGIVANEAPVSIPERTVIPVSAATPAAVQVANDDATDPVSDAGTAEAQDAVDPEAVSSDINAGGVSPHSCACHPVCECDKLCKCLAETKAAANPLDDAPVYPTEPQPGRWVIKLQPVVDQWGRLLYYRNVQVWEPTPTYQAASRSTYGQTYSSCAGGSCGVSYGRRGLFGRGR